MRLRFAGEPGQQVDHRLRGAAESRCQVDGGIDRPALNEHPEPRQKPLLDGGQQPEAPLEQGDQVAMAMIAARIITAQEAKSLIQPFEHLIRREQRKTRRGELQRERHSVETLADVGDRGRIVRRQFEIRLGVANAREKQRDGRCAGDFPKLRFVGRVFDRRQAQRRHSQHALTEEVQRLLGSRQHFELVGGAQQLDDEHAHLDGQPVAVVDQEEGAPTGQGMGDPVQQFRLPGSSYGQRKPECPEPLIRCAHGHQVKEPNAVRVEVRLLVRERQGALRLAHAAGAENGQGSPRQEQIIDLPQLIFPADERLESCRKADGGWRPEARPRFRGSGHGGLDRADVTISGTVHRLDELGPFRIVRQSAPCQGNDAIQRRGGDVLMAPHRIQKLFARQQFPRAHDQLTEYREYLGLERIFLAAAQEPAIREVELTIAAAVNDLVHAHSPFRRRPFPRLWRLASLVHRRTDSEWNAWANEIRRRGFRIQPFRTRVQPRRRTRDRRPPRRTDKPPTNSVNPAMASEGSISGALTEPPPLSVHPGTFAPA